MRTDTSEVLDSNISVSRELVIYYYYYYTRIQNLENCYIFSSNC